MHVRSLRERALLVAGERDDLRDLTLQMRHQLRELVRFARVRQHDDHIIGRDHSEVAVTRFSGMHEERRCARRRQRRGELARDMTGFADARYDNAATTIENQLDCIYEWRRQTIAERRDRMRFGCKHFAGKRKRTLRIDGAVDSGLRGDSLHRAEVYAARNELSRL